MISFFKSIFSKNPVWKIFINFLKFLITIALLFFYSRYILWDWIKIFIRKKIYFWGSLLVPIHDPRFFRNRRSHFSFQTFCETFFLAISNIINVTISRTWAAISKICSYCIAPPPYCIATALLHRFFEVVSRCSKAVGRKNSFRAKVLK